MLRERQQGSKRLTALVLPLLRCISPLIPPASAPHAIAPTPFHTSSSGLLPSPRPALPPPSPPLPFPPPPPPPTPCACPPSPVPCPCDLPFLPCLYQLTLPMCLLLAVMLMLCVLPLLLQLHQQHCSTCPLWQLAFVTISAAAETLSMACLGYCAKGKLVSLLSEKTMILNYKEKRSISILVIPPPPLPPCCQVDCHQSCPSAKRLPLTHVAPGRVPSGLTGPCWCAGQ